MPSYEFIEPVRVAVAGVGHDPSRRSLRGRRPAALRRTAFHEAGHVVMAVWLRRPIRLYRSGIAGPQTITERVLTGGRQIDPAERRRVRSSIAQAMVSLHERGELIREVEGMGKRQAVWRKAKLNGGGVGA